MADAMNNRGPFKRFMLHGLEALPAPWQDWHLREAEFAIDPQNDSSIG